MRSNVSSLDGAGRVIAGTGTALWILSMFLTFYSFGSQSYTYWEVAKNSDVIALVLAILALLILVASVLGAGEPPLLAVAVIAGYLLATSLVAMTEAGELHRGAGGYIGVLGGSLMTLGAVLAIVPAMLAASACGSARALPIMAGASTAQTAGPIAGWYDDPAEQRRLRYWDGSRWSDDTKD
jgi:hypothetical protein